MRMFTYDPSFITWLVKFAGRRLIVDVGCGEGHLVRDLRANGAPNTLGVDKLDRTPPDLYGAIIKDDATTSSLVNGKGLLLVIARPDHAGWPEKVIERANSDLLFFGRLSYLENDLGRQLRGAQGMAVPGLHDVEEGEPTAALYFQLAEKRDSLPYWLVRRKIGKDLYRASWMLRATRLGPSGKDWMPGDPGLGYWVNPHGSGNNVQDDDEILEGPVFIRHERELDWTKDDGVRGMLDRSKSQTVFSGWMSPSGEFYACEYHEHDAFAFYCLGFEVSELEEMGWIRVHCGGLCERGPWGVPHKGDLTEPQAVSMLALKERYRELHPHGEE